MPITVYDSLNEISREIKHLAGAIAGEKEIRSWFDRIFRRNHWGKVMVNRDFMRRSFYEKQIK
jgi:hypothetical protein